MFICSMVDYGIYTYIEAVRYVFISKICFCALMVQIAELCCEVNFWHVLGSDVFIITVILLFWMFYFSTRLKGFLSA